MPSKDPIADYADAAGLGRVERRVVVEGVLPGAESAPVALCLTLRGTWLVAAGGTGPSAHLEVENPGAVTYEMGPKQDTLRLGDLRFTIRSGARDDARATLALGRARSAAPPPSPIGLGGRHVEAPTALERAALGRFLEPDEVLLAHLRVRHDERKPSALGPIVGGRAAVAMTQRRTAWVEVSDLGDVTVAPLDDVAWTFGSSKRRDRVAIGTRELWPLKNLKLFTELAPVGALGPAERMLEVARLCWLGRRTNGESLGAARQLLDRVAQDGDPRGALLQFLIAEELDEPLASRPDLAPLAAALDSRAAGLGEIVSAWQPTAAALRALVGRLRAIHPGMASFALHRALDEAHAAPRASAIEAALVSLARSEHARDAGAASDAEAILIGALEALPRPKSSLVDGANAAALTAVRVRMNELLAGLLGPRGDARQVLEELARLQPLDEARHRAVVGASPPGSNGRHGESADVLAAGGLARRASAPGNVPLGPLPSELIEQTLRDPAARERADVLASLQSMVATAAEPDLVALRDYCERLDESDTRGAGSLAAAARALGLADVRGFVSRGRKDVGIRSFAGPPAFVLVGARHVDAQGDLGMTERELLFAIGGELAHLRFGHTRVTATEVWQGALTKSRQGVDVLLGFLPVLKGLKVAGRFGSVAAQLEPHAVKRALEGANALNQKLQRALHPSAPPEEPDDPAIAARNEQMIDAHRMMQRSADRAGLVLAGDLRAALRSAMLLRTDYAEALTEAAHRPLATVLYERVQGETDAAFLDLAERLAAMVRFYVSESYDELRRSLGAR